MNGAGVVAFLFTDLVESTVLLDRLGDDAADEVRRRHFELLRQAVDEAGGEEVKNLGDGLMVSFASPVAAVGCAVAMQRAMAGSDLRIRVGVHAGEALEEGDDYFGAPVVIAKRLCDRAEAGQILASELLAGLVGSRGGFRFGAPRRLALKGFSEPIGAAEVQWQVDAAAPPVTRPGDRASRPGRRSSRPRGPRIVGRERELGVLEQELSVARAGELRCVLLTGDAGLGKTRLIAELLARCDDAVALTGRAHPMGETTAFGLWAEALDGHLRRLDPADVARLCGGFLDDLAGLLRSVAAVRGSLPASSPPRSALLEGITVVLDHLCDEQPVVVVLDDVHQADASSLDALAYLGRNLTAAPVLVVLAARPVELAGHPVANPVLLSMEQDGLLSRLAVGPLDNDGLAELAGSVLGAPPPAALVTWLAARSQGNPLFAHGLLRALLEEGADLSAPRLRHLPEDLTDRVRALLGSFGAPALGLLELLSVIGRPATFEELAGLSAKAPDDLSAALDALIRARAVAEDERGGEPAFAVAHPLVQETVYANVGTPRRRLLHRDVGRNLLAARRAAEAAPHFARSAAPGDGEAIEALRQALREAEDRRAFREALGMMAGLVEILPEGDERWLDIGQVLSGEAEWAEYPNASRADAELAIRGLRAIDAALDGSAGAARRGILKLRLSHLLAWGVGDTAEAARVAAEALRLFEEAGDAARVLQARHELAWARGLMGGMDALFEESQAICTAALARGDELLAILALSASGNAGISVGRFSDAEQALRRGIALARTGLRRPPTQLRSILGFALALQGRVAEAREEFAAARAADPRFRNSNLLELCAMAFSFAGDVRLVLECAEETIAWNPGALTAARAMALPFAALMAVEADRPDLAHRYCELALSATRSGDWHHTMAASNAVLARLDVIGGDRGALNRLAAAVRQLVDTSRLGYAGSFVLDLAELAGEVGDEAMAASAVDMLVHVTATSQAETYDDMRGLAAAWAALARGDPGQASALARETVRRVDGRELPLLLGRAYDVLGRALASHDPTGSDDAFSQAAALFESCGATGRLRRVRAGAEHVERRAQS